MKFDRRSRKQVNPTKYGIIDLECLCGRLVTGCSADTKSVTCAYCVQLSVAPPDIKPKPIPKADRPPKPEKVPKPTAGWGRGWHLKEHFVAPNGAVYKKGKLVKKAKQVA